MKKYNNEWFFGNGLGLNFNNLVNGKPTGTTPSTNGNALYTLEGSSSICNPDNGELLFYTDGTTIWDSNHQPLKDGNGAQYELLCNPSSTNAAIIVPIPGTKNEFFIITPSETSGLELFFNNQQIHSGELIPTLSTRTHKPPHIKGIRQHRLTVDLVTREVTVNSHNDAIQLPTNVGIDLSTFITEKLCVASHKNCTDYWLITEIGSPQLKSSRPLIEDAKILVFEITNAGIAFKHVFESKQAFSSLSTIKVNHSGTKIAIGTHNNLNQFYTKTSRLDVYKFDNDSGVVDISTGVNYFPFTDLNTKIYGFEFSKNEQYLYFATDHDLFQLDLTTHVRTQLDDTNFADTSLQRRFNDQQLPKQSIPHLWTAVGALSMGPDGVIYVARPGFQAIGAITEPDKAGMAAGFVNNYIDYTDASNPEILSYKGLPTMLNLAQCDKTSQPSGNCEEIAAAVNSGLIDQCQSFVNEMPNCNDDHSCDCDTSDTDDCKAVEKPEISPCIKIKWGQTENSCLSGCGSYTMCITVCNCYSNIAFKNFAIGLLEVVGADGEPIEISENGKSALQIVPRGPYSFGTIEACSCISREFTLNVKCPKPGKYKVKMDGICYDVCFHYDSSDCFHFDICPE